MFLFLLRALLKRGLDQESKKICKQRNGPTLGGPFTEQPSKGRGKEDAILFERNQKDETQPDGGEASAGASLLLVPWGRSFSRRLGTLPPLALPHSAHLSAHRPRPQPLPHPDPPRTPSLATEASGVLYCVGGTGGGFSLYLAPWNQTSAAFWGRPLLLFLLWGLDKWCSPGGSVQLDNRILGYQ